MLYRRLVVAVALVVAACGGGNTPEEISQFRELCHEADGAVLRVHSYNSTERYECFTGLTQIELDGWQDDES